MSMQEAARRQLQSKQDRAQDERPRPPMTMREVRDAERKGRPRKKKSCGAPVPDDADQRRLPEADISLKRTR